MRQRVGVVAMALLALAGWAAAYTPCTEPCPEGCTRITERAEINGQVEDVCRCTGCPEVLHEAPMHVAPVPQRNNPHIKSTDKAMAEESVISEDASEDENADAATADDIRIWADARGIRIIRINSTHAYIPGTATYRSVYIASVVAAAGWLGLFGFVGLSIALYCKWQETQKELDSEREQGAERLVLGNTYDGIVSKPLGMSSTMGGNAAGSDASQSGWM